MVCLNGTDKSGIEEMICQGRLTKEKRLKNIKIRQAKTGKNHERCFY